LWDGKVWNLQVSNATASTLELRALMSASNGSNAWDLRCYVREKLIAFIQQNYPESLPRTRATIEEIGRFGRNSDGDDDGQGKLSSNNGSNHFASASSRPPR
jgi:hypothetical protein